MYMQKFYVHLKCNDELTGNSRIAPSRYLAAIHFANKKQISLKDWLKIYTIHKHENYF